MIYKYNLGERELTIKSELAAGRLFYIYYTNVKDKLIYSDSLVELLNFEEVKKPLKISEEGIVFLLQMGVVPPPKTVYKDIYILGIGDSAIIRTENNKIELGFKNEFPFVNHSRRQDSNYDISFKTILQKLYDAIDTKVNRRMESFVFHSAGKDSNPLALAIAEAGAQNRYTLITHKTNGVGDESLISKTIAKRLGFKHIVLSEVEKFDQRHIVEIERHFTNSPLPCTDNVSIVYPLYVAQQPILQNCNVIDGMGSDVYIGHVPSKSEYEKQQLASFFSRFNFLNNFLHSGSKIVSLTRTRAEWTGLFGLTPLDIDRIYKYDPSVSRYLKRQSVKNIDYLDFRSSVRGRIIDTEIFMRKVRNFADAFNNNLIFPWADESVVKHFMHMPEKYLIDRNGFRNKVLIRQLLKEKLELDSDKIGKMGYSYNSSVMILNNIKYLSGEILNCELWNKDIIYKYLDLSIAKLNKKEKNSSFYAGIIYRLYLISAWHNMCRWIN